VDGRMKYYGGRYEGPGSLKEIDFVSKYPKIMKNSMYGKRQTGVRKIISFLVKHLPSPRVIQDGLGRQAYLSRYYLIPGQRPIMTDGSDPFDKWGNPKEGAIWPNTTWGLYLHHFHRSDVDRELHSHPWNWAISLILAGGYVEERREGNKVVIRKIRPGNINLIMRDDFHRVDLREYDAWTLFLVGPKKSSWGFWDRVTGKVTHWRDFLAEKQREVG
jgi:hypothetical protein